MVVPRNAPSTDRRENAIGALALHRAKSVGAFASRNCLATTFSKGTADIERLEVRELSLLECHTIIAKRRRVIRNLTRFFTAGLERPNGNAFLQAAALSDRQISTP